MIPNLIELEINIMRVLGKKASFIQYRVSKYNPSDRDSKGRFLKEDWTSYCDIGKKFENKIFTKEEYIKAEEKYCQIILSVLKDLMVEKLKVENLEMGHSLIQLKNMLEEVGLTLSAKDELILKTIENKNRVNDLELQNYLRLLLRECFWCELKDNSLMITTGYDFYVYIFSLIPISNKIIEESREEGIYIEKMTL